MESEVLKIAESLIIRDSLGLYMAKLREHEGHPNFQVTMAFVASLYKRYSKIASTKCERDLTGRLTVRKNIRTDFDTN